MTSPLYVKKQPSEILTIGIDFTNLLSGTDTISTIDNIAITILGSSDTADLVVQSSALNSDADTVNIKLSGGTHGKSYQITAQVTTVGAEVLEGDGVVVVRELIWYYTPLMILRNLIDDLSESPEYSNTRLLDVFLVGAYQVNQDLDFDYTIDLEKAEISPDPSDDEGFINLATLKAACILDRGSMRLAAAVNGLSARCGPAQMTVNQGRVAGFGLLIDKGYCAAYQEASRQYAYGNVAFCKGILSPFINEDFIPHEHINDVILRVTR